MSRPLISAAVLILGLFPSCASGPPAAWVPSAIPACSAMRLWEITRLAMEREGFVVLQRGFDPKTRTATSGWRKELHPFKGRGYRERVLVRYGAGAQAGTMKIGVRIEREINQNLSKPLDPEYADWGEAPDNTERAKVVLQYIRSLLGPDLNIGKKTGLEKEKEKKYGEW